MFFLKKIKGKNAILIKKFKKWRLDYANLKIKNEQLEIERLRSELKINEIKTNNLNEIETLKGDILTFENQKINAHQSIILITDKNINQKNKIKECENYISNLKTDNEHTLISKQNEIYILKEQIREFSENFKLFIESK